MTDNLIERLSPLLTLVKEGAEFAFDPVDDATGEVDLSEVGEALTKVLRDTLGLKIPPEFRVVKLVFDTKAE